MRNVPISISPISRAAELIAGLGLEPHPEGGFYREIFRSCLLIQPADGRGARAALTTIYFLLPGGEASRWHRVTSDEVWHFYEGAGLELLELDAECRSLSVHRLGPLAADSQAPVCTIAAGRWQAARPLGDYALVGCTVSPGFDFADFAMLADDAVCAARVRSAWPDLTPLI
ncbi:MAG TPA: cupin domain-containing protein [Steroidobacteraceae bacterium]|nr:cupin domain-containing protein [Steroidobacteraceae bacterium]